MTDEEVSREFGVSVVRIAMVRHLITEVGRQKLAQMTDENLRKFWRLDVCVRPEKYGLNAGALTGLSTNPGVDFNGGTPILNSHTTTSESEPRAISFETYELSDMGLRLIRAMCQ